MLAYAILLPELTSYPGAQKPPPQQRGESPRKGELKLKVLAALSSVIR